VGIVTLEYTAQASPSEVLAALRGVVVAEKMRIGEESSDRLFCTQYLSSIRSWLCAAFRVEGRLSDTRIGVVTWSTYLFGMRAQTRRIEELLRKLPFPIAAVSAETSAAARTSPLGGMSEREALFRRVRITERVGRSAAFAAVLGACVLLKGGSPGGDWVWIALLALAFVVFEGMEILVELVSRHVLGIKVTSGISIRRLVAMLIPALVAAVLVPLWLVSR
jgi:hypothetical protein